ncbi:tyrosine-type recombinase/integrase [Sinomonas sp. JGH33]|uniref:Tyrosine-type recombinase/integrase n=1 Tax=Sinomonas terricola TaxID=3110330 RepID=A0ABU5TB67_9MICC|nr:tyrosine-type recombinase/integrase [Sinomonas sp. JGH33]MEA5456930.1 tyrosine-type recombinase/integrase [Sinomonas sp. JGH33]
MDELEARSGLDVRRIVEVLIDTGRRPEEACQLPWDCLDATADDQQVLIYTDSKNNRPNRRLPISAETAELIRGHRENVRQRFPNTPLDRLALFPRDQMNPYGTFHVGVPHMSTSHRAFIDSIADQLLDDAGQPYPAAVIVPYAYRHSYAQRHADHGTPPDVLRDLMGHVSMQTTMGYYRVTEKRVRHAVNQVAQHQFDSQGRRVFADVAGLVAEEHARLRVGQVAVPFGVCTEPSNVKAGGHACPYKYSCIGCGHFRSDASYLPELKSYLQQLLADRERILAATDVQEWARAKAAPGEEEIAQLRGLIRLVEDDLDQLSAADQQRIREAIDVIRSARQTVSLGMPGIALHQDRP